MSDLEFDVLDELYFVQPFSYLQDELELNEETLKNTLKLLLSKSWIKCFKTVTDEVLIIDELDFENHYKKYYYLASKKGLLAHNGR